MSFLLSFVNPLEYLLRFTVITGTIICAVGVSICLMAKRITMAKRGENNFNKKDRLYKTLMLLGLCFLLVGMIIIALPIDATFYMV